MVWVRLNEYKPLTVAKEKRLYTAFYIYIRKASINRPFKTGISKLSATSDVH